MGRIMLSVLTSFLMVCSVSANVTDGDIDIIDPIDERVGYTVRKSPVVYFYLSHVPAAEIRFTLVDTRQLLPVADVVLPSPAQPGFVAIRFADHHLVLEEEVQYRWYVSIVRDPSKHARDTVAGGIIERVDPQLVDYYGQSCDSASLVQAFQAGLWTDGFDCLDELIEASPENEKLRRLRERLWRDREFTINELPEAPLEQKPACPPVCGQ